MLNRTIIVAMAFILTISPAMAFDVFDTSIHGNALDSIFDYKYYVDYPSYGFSYVSTPIMSQPTGYKEVSYERCYNPVTMLPAPCTTHKVTQTQYAILESIDLYKEVALLKQAIYELKEQNTALKEELCVWNKDYKFC